MAFRKASWCRERERWNWRAVIGCYRLSFLFFALGTSSSRLGGSLSGVTGDGVTGVGVMDGSGHTKSLVSSRQNSRIFSKRYCWRSKDSPVGWITDGRSEASGFQVGSFRRRCSSSAAPECSWSLTTPGEDVENEKWWYFLMPVSQRNFGERKFTQSLTGTMTSPVWLPTSWHSFTSEED